MTTIKKVLCAIDLTKASRNAFDRALSIARASKARLYILHAVPANQPFARHQNQRLELLTSRRDRAEHEGVPVRTVEQHGDPARTIVLHANARKPISSSSDPTGGAGGSAFGKVPSENVCYGAPRGLC